MKRRAKRDWVSRGTSFGSEAVFCGGSQSPISRQHGSPLIWTLSKRVDGIHILASSCGNVGTSHELSELECQQPGHWFYFPELAPSPPPCRPWTSHWDPHPQQWVTGMAPRPPHSAWSLANSSRVVFEDNKLINKGPSLTLSKYCQNEGTSLPIWTHVRVHRP